MQTNLGGLLIMNVKSIEKNGNQATVVVEIDKELMEKGINAAYLKARKQIMIPGFRKGKAPRKMIEAMYGAHVFYEDGLDYSRLFAVGSDIDQHRISLFAVGDADCTMFDQRERYRPKIRHLLMVILSVADILEKIILAETIGKSRCKTFNVVVLHHIAVV